MGADDDRGCVEHVWVLVGLHLSLLRGVEMEEVCRRCGALHYATDLLARSPRRRPLSPVRWLRSEERPS